jgi:hypothetical protein
MYGPQRSRSVPGILRSASCSAVKAPGKKRPAPNGFSFGTWTPCQVMVPRSTRSFAPSGPFIAKAVIELLAKPSGVFLPEGRMSVQPSRRHSFCRTCCWSEL